MSKRESGDRSWSQASDSLFRASRADHDPTVGDRARVRVALARRLANGAPLTTAGGAPAAATKALGRATLGNAVKISLGVACVATAAFVFTRNDDSPPERAGRADLVARAHPTPTSMPAGPLLESGPRESPASSSTSPSTHATNTAPPHAASQRARPDTAAENGGASVSKQQARSSVAAGAQHPGDVSEAALHGSPPTRSENGVSTAASPPGAMASQTGPAPAEPTPAAAAVPDDKQVDARSELDLVKRIHLAMRDGDLSGALALCAQHERRWPHGTFAQEREGVRAIASCESHSNEAGRRARAFLETYPHAALAPRVAATCATQLAKSGRDRAVSGVD